MTSVRVTLALGNIKSNPRMTPAQELRAMAALAAFAHAAHYVLACEVAYKRMRTTWQTVFAGWTTAGAKAGSENVVSVRAGLPAAGATVSWLSVGRRKVTPVRTTTHVDSVIDGLTIRVISTHLISQWQSYAKAKASVWSWRNRVAKREIKRLGKQVAAAHAAGIDLVLIGGDLNAISNVHIAAGQVQLLGVKAKAGGNLGKMMQASAFPRPGLKVTGIQRWRHAPVATDHPFRLVSFTVVEG